MAVDPLVRARVSLAGAARSARATRRHADRGAPRIALIPAHDEQEQIEAAIRSLKEQEVLWDLVVVCGDNCADDTAARAEAAGAHVFEGVESPKAGVLEQAPDILLRELQDEDTVLVMDADSVLARRGRQRRPCGASGTERRNCLRRSESSPPDRLRPSWRAPGWPRSLRSTASAV